MQISELEAPFFGVVVLILDGVVIVLVVVSPSFSGTTVFFCISELGNFSPCNAGYIIENIILNSHDLNNLLMSYCVGYVLSNYV